MTSNPRFLCLKYILVLPVLLCAGIVHAQLPVSLPSAYDTSRKVNHVRSWDALAPEKDEQVLLARPVTDVRQSTQYLDGLGRPLQTVMRQGSLVSGGTPVDMVSAIVYDSLGREVYKYLPFAADTAGGNSSLSDGLFKENPFQQQNLFYNKQLAGQAGEVNLGSANRNWAYGKTNFEPSPLNRVMDTYAPGTSWVGSEGNTDTLRRNVRMSYLVNTLTDSVHIWTVTDNDTLGSFGSYATSSLYGAGELFKTITTDEHKAQMIEFKDKNGRVILKKVQLTAAADTGSGKGYIGWLSTYYIYDDLGNLRAVIQPGAVKAMALAASWTLTATMLSEQCFRYEYDQRNRMIVKRVPGAAPVRMVYDVRDRLVLMQDGNLAGGTAKWLYTQYDELNRPIASGLWTTSSTWATLAAAAEGSAAYPAVSGSSFDELTHTYYDDYSWLPANGDPFSSTRSTADDGSFLGASTGYPYPQALTQSNMTRGMVTGTKTKVLGTSSYLYSISYYDDKGRVIQTQGKNVNRGTDVTTVQYSFSGQVLMSVMRHHTDSASNRTHIISSRMSYDELGRAVKSEKRVHSIVGSSDITKDWSVMAVQQYDAIGQLKTKKLGSKAGSSDPLETLSYDHNVRGWLLGMNRSYVKDSASGSYFGFDLGYDRTGALIPGSSYAKAEYNGNISGMLWRSRGDGVDRQYDFGYDNANRLLKADFKQHNADNSWNNAIVNYTVKMGNGIDAGTAYDDNGNILKMQQYGLKITSSMIIDSLLYTYQGGSNKLAKVADGAIADSSKLGDFKDGTNLYDDYSYDVNGNLVSDSNKHISGIHYNHLNLPDSITVAGKGSIVYVYDAGGNKLKKLVHETGKADRTTTYINGMVYEQDSLQFIPQEEGRIRYKYADSATAAELNTDYFLKDHLGNVRMVLTEEQQVDRYPAATMETAPATIEEAFYANVNTTRENLPSGYPTDNTTSPNDKVAKVNGSGNKIGPSMVLRVMAGDSFNIKVSSWYKTNGATPGTPSSPVPDIVNALLTSLSGVGAAGGHGFTPTSLGNTGIITTGASNFFDNEDSLSNTARPRAYLNWVLLDEQFNLVAGSSGFEQVGSDEEFKQHVKSGMPVDKNGYLYVYVSNITPNIDVFFDNLQVTHDRGAILEETHYYPFGLVMAGISSKAAGGMENRNKFVTQEFDDDLEWNTYQFRFRTYDPQMGRFLQVDPLAMSYVYNTPYAYAENDVIRAIDAEGLEKYIKVINEIKGSEANNIVKKTIFTKINENGNLIDQHLKSSSNNKIMTTDEAYTFDNKTANNDGSSQATFSDKFIVKNGVVSVDDGPNEPNEIKDGSTVVAYTDPIAKGEKGIISEGYVSSTNGTVGDEKQTISQRVVASPSHIINMLKSEFVAAVGDKKLNIGITFSINPQNKNLYKQMKAVQKELGMTVLPTTGQKVNTFNITFVGVKK